MRASAAAAWTSLLLASSSADTGAAAAALEAVPGLPLLWPARTGPDEGPAAMEARLPLLPAPTFIFCWLPPALPTLAELLNLSARERMGGQQAHTTGLGAGRQGQTTKIK